MTFSPQIGVGCDKTQQYRDKNLEVAANYYGNYKLKCRLTTEFKNKNNKPVLVSGIHPVKVCVLVLVLLSLTLD